jgi:hypothetical protein
MRKRNNQRIDIWTIIKERIENRMRENEAALNAVHTNPEALPYLRRIHEDDKMRHQTAIRWINYHQGA